MGEPSWEELLGSVGWVNPLGKINLGLLDCTRLQMEFHGARTCAKKLFNDTNPIAPGCHTRRPEFSYPRYFVRPLIARAYWG
ncbi:hypothetical protein SK128_004509 [Halocaridina rubra]|uniref:Uncharacterized protein n=1 Tax=Halocaridina rubra TaxID=373956 RepID=A0AAN9AGH5_HALRR